MKVVCAILCLSFALVPCRDAAFTIYKAEPQPAAEQPEAAARLGDIWSNCGKSDDIVKINSLKVSPDPPKKGPISISGNVTTSKDIMKGNIRIKATYGVIPLLDETVDLCDTLKQVNMTCPLSAGTYALTQSATIPSEAPKGHYKGSVVGTDSNGDELFCIDLDGHLE